MSSNLINNYISVNKEPQQRAKTSNASSKPVVGLKPLQAQGRLLAPTPRVGQNIAYNIKSIKNGFAGESNDHQLGKINDIGLMLGGLGIAGLLFTQRQTMKTKIMEVVGFGSFFAAMSLWPKVALHLPARIIHGFNVGQKYEDSQGRKKPFFQDPQYLPWDLYDDKTINKIGDRLHVSKDIPNRKEFIQEKMKKIAIQNNTMWMLTAGFAAPIMSALICNAAEKPIEKFINKTNNDKADKLLKAISDNNMDEINRATKIDYKKSKESLNALLEANINKPLTDNLIEQIAEKIAPGVLFENNRAIIGDLSQILKADAGDNRIIDAEVVQNALNKATGYSAMVKKDQLKTALPTLDEVTAFLSKNGHLNTPIESYDIGQVSRKLADFIADEVEKKGFLPNTDKKDLFADDLFDGLCEDLDGKPALNLDVAKKEKINQISDAFVDFSKKSNALDKYGRIKIADSPESVLANTWGEITKDLDKLFGFTKEEITKTHYERLDVQNLLRDKIEKITAQVKVGDKVVENKQYIELIQALTAKLNKVQSIINPADFDSQAEKIYGAAADALSKLGMKKTADNLVQRNLNGAGSMKRLASKAVQDRIEGVENAIKRLISTLDIYHRISNGNFGPTLNANMPLEVVEEGLETAKQIALQGHAAHYYDKFNVNRSANPDVTRTGVPNVKDGKVQNTLHNVANTNGTPYKGVEVPYDPDFFKNVIRFMHENQMSPETKNALGSQLEAINTYRSEMLTELGKAQNKVRPRQTVASELSDFGSKTLYEKFNLTGLAPDEMFTKIFKQKFNSGKWMKIFGRFAVTLGAITVASQFFFGKMQEPKENKGTNA